MFEKYLDDYYKFRTSVKEIAEKEEIATSTFNRWLKRNGLLSRQKWFERIDTGVAELDKVLHDRYIYMLKRVKYKKDDRYERYKLLEYLSVYEYVELCNVNKGRLIDLWDRYIESGQEPRFAISLDRKDNEKGYTTGNIDFTTHGFNSWKRSATPIKTTHGNDTHYFLTKEDASLFYGLRRQAIGEIYNRTPYHVKGYEVEDTTLEEVLEARNIDSMWEYYETLLQDEEKVWDERKRERYPSK